jgi:asparagine synthase (glutamine-hydrolysing)
MLFGWLPADGADANAVIAPMGAALRTCDGEHLKLWSTDVLGIGILERPLTAEDGLPDPVTRPDGYMLWMSGEAFEWPSGGLRSAAETRTAAFRLRLLDLIVARGATAIADLDGEYHIAVWNPRTRTLRLFNDRFGALPLYVGSSQAGCAFAGGVRGVLMAPGISPEPDVDAIREAVSFGGYRLGGRTNIVDVRMVPTASVVTLTPGRTSTARYWSWSQLPDDNAADERALIEEAQEIWRGAIDQRLAGSQNPGLTLSGGLDSRAILAEASRLRPRVRAITYGVPTSDDVEIARRAARVAGADWQFFPLYTPGWLERRSRRIFETDGLMDLVDLMHTEPFTTFESAFDVCLSGYIGDVVAGSTWFFDRSAQDLLSKLPYYGGPLGVPHEKALELAEDLIRATAGAPRFAVYEHKAPQSINRITAAARPFVSVRRPFVAYRFFELCQRLPKAWRMGHRWRERWLLSAYPQLFTSIPNQQTGVPPQSSRLRREVTRMARFASRRIARVAASAGLPVIVPERTFHPDERFWVRPSERSQIEATILRPDSISCEVFGRARLAQTVRDFFDHAASPVQVIGALYVFEYYHQHLAQSLANAHREVAEFVC